MPRTLALARLFSLSSFVVVGIYRIAPFMTPITTPPPFSDPPRRYPLVPLGQKRG